MQFVFGLLACFLLVFGFGAFADVNVPTITKVFFEKDEKPYEKPLDFTVECYGYEWTPGPNMEKEPGTYTPEVVYSFSASCPIYGCEIHEPYYLNYRHIDYCNLTGRTEGKAFKIEKYGNTPIDFNGCNDTGKEEDFMQLCTAHFAIPENMNPIPPEPTIVCGNGKCESGESRGACPVDCSASPPQPPQPNPQPPQNFVEAFLQSVICFFSGLFGKSC